MGGIFRTNNPLEYAEVDGIVIDERAPAPNIQGVATNVVLLLGEFERGSEDITTIGSTVELFNNYGNNISYGGQLALANKRFGLLKIKRVVAADAAIASQTLQDGLAADIATLSAKSKGVYGNSIDVTIEASDVSGKLITIRDLNSGSDLPDEIYDEVTAANLLEKLGGSALVDVAIVDDQLVLEDQAATALAGGSDGTIADTDYETALNGSLEEGVANIVMLDSYTPTRNEYLQAHAAATQDRMVICGGPLGETVTEAEAAVALLRDTDGRIIYAYNWLQTLVGGVNVYTSPAHWIASIMSQTSPHIDPAFSGNTEFLQGASDVNLKLGRTDYIRLMRAGIAGFENDSDIGIKLRSGVVTQIANSSKVTITRRRMADWYTNSVGIFLKLYQNAVNSRDERDNVNAAIQRFDQQYSTAPTKILPSNDEVRDGSAVLIDTESLNTDQSIGEGKFFIKIKRRLYSSMRFIVLIAEIGESVVVTEVEG
jgi:hypothetical protein